MTSGILLSLVFALGWVPLFVFRAEALTKALPVYRGAERLWVQLTPALLALHVTAACATISALRTVPVWPAAGGVAAFAAAIAFWFWGRLLIGPLRRQRLPDEPPLRLRRDGAFGVVRHPLYLGYLLAAAAPLVIVPRFLLVVTFTLSGLALAVRAVQEERRLKSQLGAEYEAYCRQVKRLLPFVW